MPVGHVRRLLKPAAADGLSPHGPRPSPLFHRLSLLREVLEWTQGIKIIYACPRSLLMAPPPLGHANKGPASLLIVLAKLPPVHYDDGDDHLEEIFLYIAR